MANKSRSYLIANILLVIVVVTHILGIIYFRAQPPANTPEGMSSIEAINTVFIWYTFIVFTCLVSVFYRAKCMTISRGKSKYINSFIAVITSIPVFVYIYVVYENIT
jgi:magnesium-transporting ATPase (P-type)